ncbi:MAG: hypothetical protein KGY42_03930 [Desulfobacterales bacterium]|nr:hypothetical protein [Desulfobacterales bacterium]MBS3756467.1 hypothetical protein [Desulfobacterales bacterium]
MHRIALVIMVLAGLMVSGSVSPAFGYVIPGPFVIEKMLDSLDLPEGMRVKQEIRIPSGSQTAASKSTEPIAQVPEGVGPVRGPKTAPENKAEPARAFVQQVRYRLPEAFRSDIETARLNRIHVFYRGESITVLDGRVVSGGPAWHTCYKDLFLFSSRKPMVRYLERLGIDMDQSSLGRMDKNLVYVLGARYPDKSRQQIWVDKASFRPVRWIVTPAEDPQSPPVHEIRYREWRQKGDTWYPGTIEFYENGEKAQTMAVQQFWADSGIPADLFDIGVLRRTYGRSDEKAPEEGEPGEEIREEIEEFKNIYEY